MLFVFAIGGAINRWHLFQCDLETFELIFGRSCPAMRSGWSETMPNSRKFGNVLNSRLTKSSTNIPVILLYHHFWLFKLHHTRRNALLFFHSRGSNGFLLSFRERVSRKTSRRKAATSVKLTQLSNLLLHKFNFCVGSWLAEADGEEMPSTWWPFVALLCLDIHQTSTRLCDEAENTRANQRFLSICIVVFAKSSPSTMLDKARFTWRTVSMCNKTRLTHNRSSNNETFRYFF